MKKFLPLLLGAFLFTSNSHAQVTFDPDFGNEGKIVHGAGGSQMARMKVLPDGKILAAGPSNGINAGTRFRVTRCLENGTLDTTFGDGTGFSETSYQAIAFAKDFAVQPDGKIVVIGYTNPQNAQTYNAYDDIMVVRYMPDGTPDATFGDNGVKIFEVEGSQEGNCVAVQSDGKIIIGAYWSILNGAVYGALIRLLDNGDVDETYGNAGVATLTNIPYRFHMDGQDRLTAIATQYSALFENTSFSLSRNLSDGSPDPEFGTDGLTEITMPGMLNMHMLTLDPGGKIYVSGQYMPLSKFHSILMKFGSDGFPDAGFGTEGTLIRDFGSNQASSARDVSIDANGDLVVGYSAGATSDYDFVVGKLDSNGNPKSDFGTDGFFSFEFLDGHEYLRAVQVLPNGRILAGGFKYTQLAMARLIDPALNTAEFSTVSKLAQLAPNPVTNRSELRFYLENPASVQFRITDVSGKSSSLDASGQSFGSGWNAIAADGLSNLAKGVYFLSVEAEGQPAQTLRFIR